MAVTPLGQLYGETRGYESGMHDLKCMNRFITAISISDVLPVLADDRLDQSPNWGAGMQTTVRDLLKLKSGPIRYVADTDSVLRAVELLVQYNISAVSVLDGSQLIGIVTERDVARSVVLTGTTANATAVSEIMTRDVLVVRPEHTIEECMALMTERRIRHLPVLEGTRLIGILSIRDLVDALVSQKQFVIEQLENYITGRI